MKHIKDFFSTSTKAAIITGCIFGILAVCGIRGVFAAGDADTKKEADSTAFEQEVIRTIVPQKADSITLEAAKGKALKDAGLQETNVTFKKIEQDYEEHIPVYELDFYADDMEYEYVIYAETGAIYSKSKELIMKQTTEGNTEKSGKQSKVTASPNGGITNNNNFGQEESDPSYIGTDAAKSIAVKHANMKETDVIFSKVKLDKEDGVMAYEIEFVKDGMEYEYTLEALTGDILEYDVERTDYN